MLVALAALTLLTACDKDKYRTWFFFTGSQENGNILIGSDGVRYTPVKGEELIMPIPVGLERVRMGVRCYLPEGRNPITGEREMDIEVIEYRQLPTRKYSRLEEFGADDPIYLPTLESDNQSITSLQPGIIANQNYLEMNYVYRAYMEDEDTNIEVDLALEIDPEIISGGAQGDTITMRLKFNNNPEEITPDADNPRENYGGMMSFDLQGAAQEFGFPVLDGNTPIPYIIKMSYNSFSSHTSPNDEQTQIRYVTCKWVPADPYREVEEVW